MTSRFAWWPQKSVWHEIPTQRGDDTWVIARCGVHMDSAEHEFADAIPDGTAPHWICRYCPAVPMNEFERRLAEFWGEEQQARADAPGRGQ